MRKVMTMMRKYRSCVECRRRVYRGRAHKPDCSALRAAQLQDILNKQEKIPTAGVSTCPICGHTWAVCIDRNSLMPACGHYGQDNTADNPSRPHESCALVHYVTCERVNA